MTRYKLLTITAILLLSGCAYNTQSRVDQSVGEQTSHPYDQQPPAPAMPGPTVPQPGPAAPAPTHGASAAPRAGTDVRTVAWLQGEPAPNILAADQQPANQPPAERPRLDLNIPAAIPGSEARRIELSKDALAKQREIEQLYPALPPLVAEPAPLPGPGGRPFTLSDFQQIAAANSPQLRQAAADVETARGNMIQANAYPNPTTQLSIHAVQQRQYAGSRRRRHRPDDQDRRKARACKPPRPRWPCTTPSWPCGGPAAICPPRSATPTSPSSWPRRRSA